MGKGTRGIAGPEKELTRLKDEVSAARRRLPMVEMTESYTFDTADGPASLLDLFDGRRQLIVQHFMFGPDWDEGCDGCSLMADHIGPLSHLHAKDTLFVLVSRAALPKLLAFHDRMGWKLPWVSSARSTFNEDFRATVDGEERHAVSVFLRDGDRVFHRSIFGGSLAVYGREEADPVLAARVAGRFSRGGCAVRCSA